MKKLLLCLLAGTISSAAFSQNATKSFVRVDYPTHVPQKIANLAKPDFAAIKNNKTANHSTSRTTQGGDRWYSYLEYCGQVNTSIASSQVAPYMWNKPDMYAIYSNGSGGLERDTLRFGSYSFSLDPTFSGFNDPSAYTGEMSITNNDDYVLDSFIMGGVYGRNINKTSSVDTLRFAFVTGRTDKQADNIQTFSVFNTPGHTDIHDTYGVDTLSLPIIFHDADNNIAAKAPGTTTSPNVVVKDVILKVGDTSTNNLLSHFGVDLSQDNVHVTAGKLVGATVTFISGEAYTPFSDTVFLGSLNPAVPFKYGMVRPAFYEENGTGTYPTYIKGNGNMAGLMFLPDTGSWEGEYYPTFGEGSADFAEEIPDVSFKLSCASCFPVSVATVSNVITGTHVYPNPATSTVNISFSLSQSNNVAVSLTNIIGQVVKTQDMGNVTSGNAAFSTSGLPNGIYIYTIQAGGERTTGRVVVAR